MKVVSKLMDLCESKSLHCSITYQKSNNYSVEIYTGYVSTYQKVYFSDGHINLKKAVKKAYKFIKRS